MFNCSRGLDRPTVPDCPWKLAPVTVSPPAGAESLSRRWLRRMAGLRFVFVTAT